MIKISLTYLIVGILMGIGLIFAPLLGLNRYDIISIYTVVDSIIGFILIFKGFLKRDLSFALIGAITALLAISPAFNWPVFNFITSLASGIMGVGTLIRSFYKDIFYY